ncbi:unnamed protein product, partial [Owenia fusiformis]
NGKTFYQNHYLHRMINGGTEVKIGNYPVEGFSGDTKTVLQFDGCYFHGHDSWLTKNAKSTDESKKQFKLRKQNTQKCNSFIRSQGFKMIIKHECEFRADLVSKTQIPRSLPYGQNITLPEFEKSKHLPFHKPFPRQISDPQNITDAVLDDTFLKWYKLISKYRIAGPMTT